MTDCPSSMHRNKSPVRSSNPPFRRQNPGLVASPDTAPARAAMLLGNPEMPVPSVFASVFLVARIIAAWVVAIIVAAFLWSGVFSGMDESPGWFFGLLAMLVMVSVLISTISHLRRVWLVAGRLDHGTLSSRQRRQIEVPFDAGVAFDLLDAAIRELPRSEEIESARDSLQISAKVKRVDPYGGKPPSRFNV